jgi:hypothetical protein
MGTIAGGAESSLMSEGSSVSVAVTQDILQWRQKHESLEQSIQKYVLSSLPVIVKRFDILPCRNVCKYYQLAEHTCSKPPRISRMDERMDKLVAYLRKFRDLNIRILVRIYLSQLTSWFNVLPWSIGILR